MGEELLKNFIGWQRFATVANRCQPL